MKASLEGLLPEDILERKKRGFGTPMGAWLKGELAPLVRDLLVARMRSRRAGCSATRRSRASSRRTRPTGSTEPIGCWRCSISRSGRASISIGVPPEDVADELKVAAA